MNVVVPNFASWETDLLRGEILERAMEGVHCKSGHFGRCVSFLLFCNGWASLGISRVGTYVGNG